MTNQLTDIERAEALTPLQGNGWRLSKDRNELSKTFEFKNFVEAFGWMTRVALHAEKLNHHPDWQNSYKRVDVTLSTHDTGGLTKLDVRFASIMDRLFSA
ncbi:MAG: 4a-hydroxytetrahydrobiopterin dehydratase [Paracoccaceae bacterium]